MKYISSLLLLTICVAFASCTHNYQLTVHFPNHDFDGKKAYLTNYDTGDTIDSVTVIEKQLILDGNVDTAYFARLLVEGNRLDFVVEEGDIEVEWGADLKISGTPLNEKFNGIVKQLDKYEQEWQNIARAKQNNEITDDEAQRREDSRKSNLLNSLYNTFLANKDNVMIMGHKRPDADAFGSAVGVYRLVKTLGRNAHIVLNEETAAKAIQTSLDNLDLGYIDLYLEHQAMGDYFAAWRAMEKAYKAGKLKAIGVANFFPNILCNFCETVEVTPAVNQVEFNPFFAQEDAITNMKNYGVQPMAWSPLAEGKHGIFTDPEMTEIGKKYGKTAAQVALRWNTQRGVVIIPKSSNPDRMAQNLDIWDFTLTEDEMKTITAKDLGHSEIINHFDPEVVKMILGMKIHP